MIGRIRSGFDFLESDKLRNSGPALSDDIGRSRVVCDSINPRSQRTSRFEPLQAAPDRKLDFLRQVAALLRIGFIRPNQPIERRAIPSDRFPKQFVLSLGLTHRKVVPAQSISLP